MTAATLHNQDFITQKDIRIGDTVLVRKAGEIIPEVLSVLKDHRPEGTSPYRLPSCCPVCGAPVIRDEDGASLRCTGAECRAQLLRNLTHFASRDAMDIDGLGIAVAENLVNAELIKSPADLYSLDVQSVAQLERMGMKSAENLIEAIDRSKQCGLDRLLYAFGIRQVGQKAAKAIALRFQTMDALLDATLDELTAISDVGAVIAGNLRAWLDSPQARHLIAQLRAAGVVMTAAPKSDDRRFEGMTFVLTGALEQYTREEASRLIEDRGGKASSSVSKKTTFLIAGESAGSKLKKATELGIPILTEDQFAAMLNE